jgi:hypothetical protein
MLSVHESTTTTWPRVFDEVANASPAVVALYVAALDARRRIDFDPRLVWAGTRGRPGLRDRLVVAIMGSPTLATDPPTIRSAFLAASGRFVAVLWAPRCRRYRPSRDRRHGRQRGRHGR